MVNNHSLILQTHPSSGKSASSLQLRAIRDRVIQGGMITLLSLVGLLSGSIPDLFQWHQPLANQSAAFAQPTPPSFTDIEIKNYALAVLLMEPIRQAAYNDIKKILGSRELPAITCHRKKDIDSLPLDIRGIAVNYCNQSRKIVISSGLTIGRFNDITNTLGSDPALEQRIQGELIRLQKLPVPATPGQ